jgi:hypothetical protein
MSSHFMDVPSKRRLFLSRLAAAAGIVGFFSKVAIAADEDWNESLEEDLLSAPASLQLWSPPLVAPPQWILGADGKARLWIWSEAGTESLKWVPQSDVDRETLTRLGFQPEKLLSFNEKGFALLTPQISPDDTSLIGRAFQFQLEKASDGKRSSTWQMKVPKLGIFSQEKASFSLLFGSCIHPEKEERIATLNTMAQTEADAVFLLGDTTYYRPQDLVSADAMLRRCRANRSLDEFGLLGAARPVQAVWDDHDFGLNDASRNSASHLEAQKVFRWQYPRTENLDGQKEPNGIAFSWKQGDVRFAILDNRSFRDPTLPLNPWNGAYLGNEQLQWLQSLIEKQDAKLLVLCGGSQFHSTNPVKETYMRHLEFRRFQDMLKKQVRVPLLFLSGDIHMTEVFDLNSTYPCGAWEITSSGIGNTAVGPLEFLKRWERHHYFDPRGYTFARVVFESGTLSWEHRDAQGQVLHAEELMKY